MISIYVMDNFGSSLKEFTKINYTVMEACGVRVHISDEVFHNIVGIYRPP